MKPDLPPDLAVKAILLTLAGLAMGAAAIMVDLTAVHDGKQARLAAPCGGRAASPCTPSPHAGENLRKDDLR